MPRSSALLRRPAAESARIIGRKYLNKLLECREALGSGDDVTALHELRVALRRLRGVLRAFRAELEPQLSPTTRRELRRLADATGECRNLQLQQAWVVEVVRALPRNEKTGARWELASIEDRRTAAFAGMHTRLTTWCDVEVPVLRRLFGSRKGTGINKRPRSTRAVVNRAGRQLADDLTQHLSLVHSIRDQSEAHAARIAAKRARYLLQPFANGLGGAPAAIEQLRQLQDDLGVLHDAQTMAGEVRNAFGRMGAGRALSRADILLPWVGGTPSRGSTAVATRLQPGLEALARRIRAEAEAAFARVEREWLGGTATELISRLRRGADGRTNRGGRI